ncbi:SH3-like domain superfamily [Babesia duncani]|uniref:SH3-like domain superfamily n=1 Tax=Babesia duncani TaxID=323732 RepID=A0AAD9PMM5_9APIC|nr:SH3-like domain superfamily [Babesia duncani]
MPKMANTREQPSSWTRIFPDQTPLDTRCKNQKNYDWDLTSTNSGTLTSAETTPGQVCCSNEMDYLSCMSKLYIGTGINQKATAGHVSTLRQDECGYDKDKNTCSYLNNFTQFQNSSCMHTPRNDDFFNKPEFVMEPTSHRISYTVQSSFDASSYDCPQLLSVRKDARVVIIARYKDWLYVKCNAKRGWIPFFTLIEQGLIKETSSNSSVF